MKNTRRHQDNSRQQVKIAFPPSSKGKTLVDEIRELRALVNILQKDINSLRADVLALKNSLYEN